MDDHTCLDRTSQEYHKKLSCDLLDVGKCVSFSWSLKCFFVHANDRYHLNCEQDRITAKDFE